MDNNCNKCNKKTECFVRWALLEYAMIYNIAYSYPILPCRLPFYKDDGNGLKCFSICPRINLAEFKKICACFERDVAIDVYFTFCDGNASFLSGLKASDGKQHRPFFSDYEEMLENKNNWCKDFSAQKSVNAFNINKELFNDASITLKYLLCMLIYFRFNYNTVNENMSRISYLLAGDKQLFEDIYGQPVFKSEEEAIEFNEQMLKHLDYEFPYGNKEDEIFKKTCVFLCEYLNKTGHKISLNSIVDRLKKRLKTVNDKEDINHFHSL